MSEVTALAAVLGAGAGLGLLTVALALAGRLPETPGRRWRARLDARQWEPSTVRVAAAVGAGVLVGTVTRWPVGAVLAAAAAWALPPLLGPDREHRRQVARTEAIAGWAEMLRDTLAAAAGLEQAILATASTAPGPIRTEVGDLAARIDQGQRLPDALRTFAAQLADPTADLVVASLVLAAERQARELGPLLGNLATAAREQATMRMRVAAGRARTRTSVRVIVTATLAMAGGLVLLNRGYLGPYDSVTGQLVLAAIGAGSAAAFAWLARMARIRRPTRFLTGLSALGRPGSAGKEGST